MPIINELNTPTARRYFSVLEEIYPESERQYDCPKLKDLDYTVLGILRCVSHAKTGHEFLQHHAEHGGRDENVDLFFKALKSKRRLKNLTSLNQSLGATMAARVPDPLGEFRELDGYRFFAADGHYQAAACFDAPKPGRNGASKVGTAHFFRVNLRSHHLSHLDLGRPADGKKKDHDARVIQRAEIDKLRGGAGKGEKVVYFWDKACVDYQTWYRLKQKGVYFVTREKSNSALGTCSVDDADHDDPRNEGVTIDTLVGSDSTGTLRRICYRDPSDGRTYTYVTNELRLPAWAIVLGYKHRWDIEKIFDQFKNKMEETKSWASGATAKESHAYFECLAHNLTLLMEEAIKKEEQLVDHLEEEKAAVRSKTRTNRDGEKVVPLTNFINRVFQRATQRTVRLIRWLRAWLYREAPWSQAIARLAKVWASNPR